MRGIILILLHCLILVIIDCIDLLIVLCGILFIALLLEFSVTQCDFPFDRQGLISGSAELREQAALGLGELIEVTSEKTLKEFVIPITGYVACILIQRFYQHEEDSYRQISRGLCFLLSRFCIFIFSEVNQCILKLSYYAFNCRPLIRIIGDRFPWQVKSAILSTLSIIIRRGGIALKPFLPQLQTTFVKCLQDNTRLVL